ERPGAVAVVFLAIFLGKGFIATLASLAMRFPARVAWLAGVSLAQFGEFGFVLARAGQSAGLLAQGEADIILAAGILTLFVTPLPMRPAPHPAAGARLLRPLERLLGVRGIDEPEPGHAAMTGHVIVAGYGVGGRLLARALAEAGAAHIVIDLDADAVHEG